MKRFSFVPGVLVVLAVCQTMGWAAEKLPGKMDFTLREQHGLEYPPEVTPVRRAGQEDVYSLLLMDGRRWEVKLLGVKAEGVSAMDEKGVFLIGPELLSPGARKFFSYSGLGREPAPAQIMRPGETTVATGSATLEVGHNGSHWTPLGGWKGVVYLADGTALSAVVDAASATHLKFTVAGVLRTEPLEKLHPVTRGELGLGNDADVAAYEVDLKRREREAVARAEAARQDVLLQAAARERREERLAQAAAEERAKRAEAWARWQREQQTEELRRIADELELRRLQGR